MPLDRNPANDSAMTQQQQAVFNLRQIAITGDASISNPAYDQVIATAFGQGFQAAFGADYTDTNDAVASWLAANTRPDSNAPAPVDVTQCRIGASTFFIPPTQITVTQQFESGSLTGAAIRQISSPKFNAGHSQATISMSLFFAGVQNIWGYGGGKIDLDFNTASDAEIDAFASSLRGFIAQFRYTPFVPIVNQYLNEVWNITSVGLQSLQISTVPGFPYLIRADVTMVDFNHSIFMPMVETLDDAIDWGRFRQFLGRAAVKLDAQATQAFATNPSIASQSDTSRTQGDPLGVDTVLKTSFASVLQDIGGASNVAFYYPTTDPAQIFGPTNFAFSSQQGGTTNFSITDPTTWFNVLGYLGLGQGNSITSSAPTIQQVQQFENDPTIQQEYNYITLFFQSISNIAGAASSQYSSTMLANSGNFEKFRSQAYIRMGISPNSTGNAKLTADQAIEGAWYTYIYKQFVGNSSALQQLFALQDFIRGTIEIDEWDVPMAPLSVDHNKIIVGDVTVNIGNNLARLQLNMVDRPAYQHVGGLDTVIQVDMTVLDEATLTAFRTMFDTINGLSRLEHAHAVLGFLGIKNLMTALVGTRYVIPRSFEVETIEGYPHLFKVRLTFLDFDVFQQKREMLSAAQEQEFIKVMSKRNPFLRIQQVWSALNTYSDFPLAITDSEGNIAGHLDPDFYFKQFTTIDDDIVNAYDTPPGYASGSTQSQNSDYPLVYHFGPMSSDGSHQSIGLHGNGMDLREGNNIAYKVNGYNEAHAGNTHIKPFVKDAAGNNPATSPAGYQAPNFEMDHTNSNSGSSKGNFFSMMRDMQFRDKSGRMIRAFPTYMLWLINENGNEFAGINLFSDFYGLQSVLDFSLVSNQDVMGDTLELRISNLYSRLSTAYQDLVDPSIFPQVATLVNTVINQDRNLATGFNPNFMVNIETFKLAPGTRMHLRCGYGADPNGLETIFNGVVTEVQQGEIMTIIAQSDAVELGAMVNTSDPHGDSGSIDGCFHKDTRLNLWDGGTLTIGEIVDNKLTPVLVGMDSRGDIVPCEVTDWFNNGPKRNWLKVRVAAKAYDDRYIAYETVLRVTTNHHIYINGEFKAASGMKVGDRILTTERQPSDSVYHMVRSSLLGDGAVILIRSTGGPQLATYQERHSHKQEEYAKALMSWMGHCSAAEYRATTGYGSKAVQVKSKGYTSLATLRDEWYVDGKKILPQDLSWVDDFTVAKWLMDDGALQGKYNVGFSTNGFSEEEVNRLGELLAQRYGVKYAVYYSKGWCLRTKSGRKRTDRWMDTFWAAVAPHVIPSLRYKVPVEFRDVPYIEYETGVERRISRESEVLEITPWNIVGTRYGGGRVPVGYDITTTVHNYFAEGILVHNSLTSGFYLSEPRDLIVRLLSMGASTFKQAISYATRGMLFSQNKFGIRHFGSILYDTMSDREKSLQSSFTDSLDQVTGDTMNWLAVNQDSAGGGNNSGILNTSIGALASQLWVNLSSQRDYEVFKRNVYPGNGLGVAQYMGGDLGDGGLNTAFQPPGVNADGQQFTSGPDPLQVLGVASNIINNPTASDGTAPNISSNDPLSNVPVVGGAIKASTSAAEAITSVTTKPIFSFYNALHPIWKVLGIQPEVTDDVPGTHIPILGTYGPFAEISFRAETYQKTVWDLFRLCAKMLPNYIVAVRPFMERSTVFYGKPHWAYTSGVIPLTYGAELNGQPGTAMFDTSMQQNINEIANLMAQSKNTTQQDLYNKLNSLTPEQLASGNITSNSNTPSSVGGDPNKGGGNQGTADIAQLPLKHSQTGAVIPYRSGPSCIEMHLPTSDNLQTDINQHQQLPDLPGPYRHPFYMDRVGGGVGGVNADNTYNPSLGNNQTEISGDSPSAPGQPGAFGILTPANEQYYMNMDWPTHAASYPSAWAGKKIMVFNPQNSKGCVCTPGDWGPAASTGRVSGISPDTWWVLGQPDVNTVLWYGFVDDSVPLGPAAWVQGNTFNGNQLPVGATYTGATTTTASAAQVSANAGQAGAADPTTSGGGTAATGTDPLAQLPPSQNVIDKLAQQVYGNTRDTEAAKEIEEEFLGLGGHEGFAKQAATKNVFKSVYPNKSEADYNAVVDDFVNKFIKTNPYCLGWIVLTANRATSLGDKIGEGVNLLIDPVGAILGPAAQGIEEALGAPQAVKDITGLIVNPVGAAIGGVEHVFTDLSNGIKSLFGDKTVSDQYDFSAARDLFKVYITQGPGQDNNGQASGAIEYMLSHNSAGLNSTNIIGQSIEGLAKNVFTDVTNFIKDAYHLASAVFGAIDSLIRWSITMFNQAISLSGFAGKQANLLTGVFNDSYYYDPSLGVGSILWQADNCLAGETEVITYDGIFTIKELAGTEPTLLTSKNWIKAPIRSFGEQELVEVILTRNGVDKVIRATPDHRWFVYVSQRGGGYRKIERLTKDLLPGNRIVTQKAPSGGDSSIISPWGVAHGFVFGDGWSVDANRTEVSLWGEKDAPMIKYFPNCHTRNVTSINGVSGTKIVCLPRHWKDYPDLRESAPYLRGWLAGYFAADGCVTEAGTPIFTSARYEDLAFVQTLCLRLGIATYEIREGVRGEGSYLPEGKNYYLTMARSAVGKEFFILPQHQDRFRPLTHSDPFNWSVKQVTPLGYMEEVFCAQVSETGDFTLAGNILSGNCFTREYGEPVVEVRQPFQRVHYINSFQHILSNNISERLTDVPTVVTASSNGKEPHTAYFDKGAPAQLQNEISVDTGLYLDSPKWYNFFLHPSQVIRDFIKHMNNSDDATECVRIARWELANGLKNIYSGEVIVLGDPSIRTFDLIYLSDQYTKITGLAQVDQVVHHFTPQMGFITSITPGAITIVNDPERWEWGGIMQRQLAIQDLRNTVRQQTKVINRAQTDSGITSNRYDPNALASSLDTNLKGTVQFGGGPTSILKDFAGASAFGMVAAGAVLGPVGPGVVGLVGWKAMDWVRHNLLDAHGCYIQYLNRNGAPMDAGLSQNQGVAVGQMHVWEGLSSALGVSIPYDINGEAQITTTDLLSNIGWNESQSTVLGNSIDMWNARTKAQLITLSGKQSEGSASGNKVLAGIASVVGVIDPITLAIQMIDTAGGQLGGYIKLQLDYLVKPSQISSSSATALAILNPAIAGVSAVTFLEQQLLVGPGKYSFVGIRVNPDQITVPGDPTTLLGTVFYQLPPNAPTPTLVGQDSYAAQFLALASKYPEIGWQSYMSNGVPYTLNWEMVTQGYATIDASILFKPGYGLESPPLDLSKFGF